MLTHGVEARHGEAHLLLASFTFELLRMASELAFWGRFFFDGFQRLQVIFGQLHEEPLATAPAPAVALDAADKPLAVAVDLHERAIAEGGRFRCHPLEQLNCSARAGG